MTKFNVQPQDGRIVASNGPDPIWVKLCRFEEQTKIVDTYLF